MSVKDFETDHSIRNISLAISIFIHAVIIFIVLFASTLKYDFPPPGKEGILVMFGDTQESTGNEDDKTKTNESNRETKEKPEEKKDKKDTPEKIEKTIEEENSEVIPESKKNNNKPEETIPEKDINDVKEEFSKLFKSKGTKKSGKGFQGDPLGSKDAEILEGITRGKGKIGEGLDSRGILYEPDFEDSSQKYGIVVVKVCINEQGNVISSRYTQRGSTTTDSELIDIAVRNAKKYRFTPSNIKKQCGTVTIEFIVK